MRSLGLLVIVHALLTSPLYSADDFRVRSAFVHKSGLTLLEVEGLQVFNDEEVKDTNWSLTHGKGGIYWSADGETYHRLKAVDDRPNIVYLRDGGRGRVVYIANSNISGHVGATVEVLYKERKGVEVPSGARFTCETTVCFKPLPNLKEIESKILHKDITLASHTDARSLEYLFEINKGTKKAYLAIDREFFDADKRTFEAWLVHPGINRQDAIDITSVEAGRVRSVMSDT